MDLKDDIDRFLDYLPDWVNNDTNFYKAIRCIHDSEQDSGYIMLYINNHNQCIYHVYFQNHILENKIKEILGITNDGKCCDCYLPRSEIYEIVDFVIKHSENPSVYCEMYCNENKHWYRYKVIESSFRKDIIHKSLNVK
jgi:hypothetical protein